MASLSPYKQRKGTWRLEIVYGRRDRVGVYLKMSKKNATTFKNFVEKMHECKKLTMPLDTHTMNWLQGLSEEYKKKLVKLKLIDESGNDELLKLGKFVEYYSNLERHKATTKKKLKQHGGKLVHYFGANKPLHVITEADAEDFHAVLLKPATEGGYGLAETTTTRRVIGYCRQIFNAAIKKRLISVNPFNTDSLSATVDKGKSVYVSKEIRQKVFDVLPSDEWRLRALLIGVNGLRGSSELNLLKWSDINFDTHQMWVAAPKTKSHRLCGIMPEVYAALRKAFDDAPEGQVNVVTPICGEALRSGYEKFMKLAGVSFIQAIRTLRKSACNDAHSWAAANGVPPNVIDEWFGHSKEVSQKYYREVTDQSLDILKAASVTHENGAVTQSVPQHTSEESGNQQQKDASNDGERGNSRQVVEPSSIHGKKQMGDIGFAEYS